MVILTIILMLFGTHSKVMEVIGWLSMAGWAVFHLVKMRCPCCGVPIRMLTDYCPYCGNEIDDD